MADTAKKLQAPPEYVTQSEFARAIGRTPSYVSQLKKQGRLIMQGGKVDLHLSKHKLEIENGLDKIQRPNRKTKRPQDEMLPTTVLTPPEISELKDPAQMSDPAELGIHALKSRTIQEHWKARREKLEFEVRSGELIPKAEAERAIFELGRRVRDAVMILPARLSGQLAGMTDQHQIERLVDLEIRTALAEVAQNGLE